MRHNKAQNDAIIVKTQLKWKLMFALGVKWIKHQYHSKMIEINAKTIRDEELVQMKDGSLHIQGSLVFQSCQDPIIISS